MSTSLSSLNTSILPLCLQNKTKPLQENPLLSGPHPPVCLIRLYLLINPPTCSTLRSRSQRNQGLLLFCLQAFRQVVLSQTLFFHLIPTHPPVQTSSSSDILLPERLTWPPGYCSHLSPDWPVSYQSNIRLDSMEDGATLTIPWTVTCQARQAPLSIGFCRQEYSHVLLILECFANFSSRGTSWPRDQTQVSCIAGRFFTHWAIREAPLWKILVFIWPPFQTVNFVSIFQHCILSYWHKAGVQCWIRRWTRLI